MGKFFDEFDEFYGINREVDDALEGRERVIAEIGDTIDIPKDYYDRYYEIEDAIYEEEIEVTEDDEISLFDNIDLGEDEHKEDNKSIEKGKTEDTSKDNSNSQKNQKWGKTVAIIGTVALLGGGVWFGINSINNKVSEASFEDIQKSIDKMYTDSSKTDIEVGVSEDKVNEYLSRAEELYNDGEGSISSPEYEDTMMELTTIRDYINDRSDLNKISNRMYDMNNQEYTSILSGVQNSSYNYTVEGLETTMTDMVTDLNDELSYYMNLKYKLQGITDYASVDINYYNDKINEVSHDPNEKELESMLDSIESKQKSDKETNDDKTTESQGSEDTTNTQEQVKDETQSKTSEENKDYVIKEELTDKIANAVKDIKDFIMSLFGGSNNEG